MLENEDLVLEGTENVEQTTEETEQVVTAEVEAPAEKTYTEAEFNAKLDEVMGKRLARNTAKIRKEYERKYGRLEEVLKAGTGKEDVTELTNTFSEFYESKGIPMPKEPTYSERDLAVLARAEAEDIIKGGLEEVIEEVDRLASIGADKMTAREKEVFKTLASYRQDAERSNELLRIGVTEDVFNSKEFKEFSAKFTPGTSVTEIYEIFAKTQPKKNIKTMGSVTNKIPDDNTVKDFYTLEEAKQFTKKDYDKNPALLKAVEKSMTKW